jgi:mlo protein
VGTKLEHVITQLAHEVAEKHAAIEGDLVVQPSDGHFWFHRPHIVLFLIHFILFQNAFEIAFFFWIWVRKFVGSITCDVVWQSFYLFLLCIFVRAYCGWAKRSFELVIYWM